MRYLLFFKPYAVLSDFVDPEGRPTLADYVLTPGVEPAGRLDADSEGLMLLTDDGRLAHALTDPASSTPRRTSSRSRTSRMRRSCRNYAGACWSKVK